MAADLLLSRHARVRRQQRRIPELVMSWLSAYGAEKKQHGATLLHFDKSARRRLMAEVGPEIVSQCSKYLNAYLVVGTNGTVVTVGYLEKRIQHH